MVLLERESELREILELVESAAGDDGRLLVIEGAAGVGKTTLLAAVAAEAERSGLAVVKASGDELERDFAFGVVRQLFDPLLARASDAERASLFAGAAGLASNLWLESPAESASRADPVSAMLHGIYWLTANLSSRTPLLISIDDAQWADVPSLRWLLYLIRRFNDLSVLVALSLRPADAGAEPGLLARIVSQPRARVLHPAPLTDTAVEALLQEALAAAPDAVFVRACHASTGGNPFLLHELVRELVDKEVAPTAVAADHLDAFAPPHVTDAVRVRLAGLTRAATALADAVALLGGGEARHAARLAELDDRAAAAAADELRASGMLRPSRRLEFEHPLVRAAVYDSIPIGERAVGHAHAAELLYRDELPAQRVAGHVVLSEPGDQDWVVGVLRRAASVALSRGAPESAIAYLKRALGEPPLAEDRAGVLRELGSAELRAGNSAGAERLMEAFETSADPLQRASIALELGAALMLADQVTEAVAVLGQARDALGGTGDELALRLEAMRVLAGRQHAATRPLALDHIRSWGTRREARTPAERVLLATAAFETALAAQPAQVVAEMAEHALAGGQLLADESCEAPAFYDAAHALVFAEEIDAADAAFAAALDDARVRGSVVGFAIASCFRSSGAYIRGAIPDAEADARAAIAAVESHGVDTLRTFAFGFLADALLERGELGAAEQALLRGGLDERAPESFAFNSLLFARARLLLARGQSQRGVEALLELGRRLDDSGVHNPAVIAWRSSASVALRELDETRARQLVGEELTLARRFGAPGPLGVALRAAGLVRGGEAGLRLLRDAVTTLDQSARALECARALVELGAALRRAGRRTDSRDILRRGLDLAHRCGGTALEKRAREELLAAGARPRRPALTGLEALTPSERRVAEIASRGLSNREIAQALFVTTRTVEVHLSHAYQKLGIGSRRDLPPPAATAWRP